MPFLRRQRRCLMVWLAVLGAAPQGLAAAQTLRGHWRPAFAAAPLLGALPQDTPLHLVLGLPLPDPAALNAFLAQVYDPHAPLYRRFLSPAQFSRRFSPSPADYQAVLDFARQQGFAVGPAWPDRLGVSVDTRASDAERVFHIQLQRRLRPDHSYFYAPDRDPSLAVALPLSHISGLDDWVRKRPRLRRHPRAVAGAHPQPRNGSAGDAYWSSVGSGFYQGWDFRQAYLPDAPASLQGAGQAIGLVEYQGYYQSDIAAYCGAQNPPIPVPTIVPRAVDRYQLTPVLTPNSSETDPLGDNSEVSLDMEAALSMAPQATLIVYEAPFTASINDILSVVVQNPQCHQVSCSWSSDGDSTTQSLFAQMAAQGQAFVNASGDNGAYSTGDFGGPVGFPDSLSPYITEAGGTALSTQGPDGSPHWCSYTSETTWNNFYDADSCATLFSNSGANGSGGASGGGICSSASSNPPADVLPLPTWQAGVATPANGGSNSYRNIPDVSICGESFWVTDNGPTAFPQSADFYNGTNHDVLDGTSGAAPLWAGVLALANQQAAAQGRGPLGSPNAFLYQLARSPSSYAQDLHDIADGSDNGILGLSGTSSCDTVIYKAVAGYDLATGLGSPRSVALINDLAGLAPTATPTITLSPSPSDSPTPSPTPSVTPTFTISPTFSVSPTTTPTPVFLASHQPRCVLAPQPARAGQPIRLYFKAAPSRTQWQVYDLAGEEVAQADIHGSGPHQCPTDALAPGLYFAHIVVDYADSTRETLLLKFAVIR